tara:strand:+ start:285 stop:545 length:261 start_codon:yes stop_codon:yes gene_type:complete
MSKKKILNIVGKLEKASDAHAGQAEALKQIARGMPMRNAPLRAFASDSPAKKLSASCIAMAKRKFKVYPSAYANMYASKQQKKGKC